ncbi:MAG: hypothetical protein L6R40_006908 [Gallowayella cf. fulva]|nr:MAG: hypothetical protein L6R40_006908 [Xanthomendoza cf. fulva]
MSSQLSEYVTLISNDDFEFIILREAACIAGTVRKMLDPETDCMRKKQRGSESQKTEASSGRCYFGEFNGAVIEKLTEYLYYNLKHRNTTNVPDMDIPPALCLDLLIAADYFDV